MYFQTRKRDLQYKCSTQSTPARKSQLVQHQSSTQSTIWAENYFASSNPPPPHSRACDREHGCVNSSMVFEWLQAYDCSTSVWLSNSTCLRADLENSNMSRSGEILGGIHWRAALAGYSAGAWCKSIANADFNIKSNNPFLSGGEKPTETLVILCAFMPYSVV